MIMKFKERIKFCGIIGAVMGGIFGLVFGHHFIYLPGIGSPLISGLVIGWVVTGFAGTLIGGGLCSLAAGTYNYRTSHDSFLQNRTMLNSNPFSVKIQDTNQKAMLPQKIINSANPKVLNEQQLLPEQTNIERWEHSLMP